MLFINSILMSFISFAWLYLGNLRNITMFITISSFIPDNYMILTWCELKKRNSRKAIRNHCFRLYRLLCCQIIAYVSRVIWEIQDSNPFNRFKYESLRSIKTVWIFQDTFDLIVGMVVIFQWIQNPENS